ncbi:helix-turn-helix domain-containing protein [Streptomyces sp. NRRL F-5126]|uniref:helix-turn-helix domain-containing protein n=1 Tax=Streptomyces sp. NRRL F-5126 TaxID=1463857 RepID=UPI0004C7FC14|nr:helix-turn-helix domain-containing protein [Streptomyces sp. NRRL F-5126]
MYERRARFGAYLRRLRRRRGTSQRGLAERLSVVSGTRTVTRNDVSRWERGARIPDAWLPVLAHSLGVPLAELEQAAAYARGDTDTAPSGTTATLAELLPDGDPLAVSPAADGRHVGSEEVAALAARVHGLRLADDVVTGGDLIAPAFRELRRAVRFYRHSTFSEETSRALLVQIGELAQIAGWIASDAGRHEDAEWAYSLGISAARQAGNGPLTAHLAGSLAYQHSNTGREREGVDLALAALEEAGPGASPEARALFLDRVAWAHAKAGEPRLALSALARAHEALGADGPEAPLWAYWVSAAEFDIMDARVFTELRRPLRAVPLLTDVLGQYDSTHTRELALYGSWRAVALIDANEPEQAADQARHDIEMSADLTSERTASRVRVVLSRLREHGDVPEVREVLDAHGRLLLA